MSYKLILPYFYERVQHKILSWAVYIWIKVQRKLLLLVLWIGFISDHTYINYLMKIFQCYKYAGKFSDKHKQNLKYSLSTSTQRLVIWILKCIFIFVVAPLSLSHSSIPKLTNESFKRSRCICDFFFCDNVRRTFGFLITGEGSSGTTNWNSEGLS